MSIAQGFALLGGIQAGARIVAGKREASAYRQAAAESRNQAQVEQVAGDKRVFDYTRQSVITSGQEQEQYAGGGVVTSTGSPLERKMEKARIDAYNTGFLKYNTDLKVRSLMYNASLSDYAARNASSSALTQGVMGVLTSGLQSAYMGKMLSTKPSTNPSVPLPPSPFAGHDTNAPHLPWGGPDTAQTEDF